MKITDYDSDEERKILTGMITSDIVLGRLFPNWDRNLFQTKWAGLLGGWCVNHYSQYKKSPGKDIESIFDAWASDSDRDESTVEMVEDFLEELSEDYESISEESNPEYLIDLAGKRFNRNKIEQLSDSLKGDAVNGDLEKASQRITSYNQIELGPGSTIDVLHDEEAIRAAFENHSEPIITYPGDLGEFFGSRLERDGFISFLAPAKSGKSFWLLDVAWQAMKQRRRVAYFDVGDHSQDQIMKRFMTRVSRKPIRPQTIEYPSKLVRVKGEDFPTVRKDDRVFDTGLSWKEAKAACDKVTRSKLKSQDPFLKLSCHANSTLSVHGMDSILQNYVRSGWIPDVIVCDYADILMPIPGVSEGRDRINETWKALRGISQRYHALVVTATQADAKSYDQKTMKKQNFSDDRRKVDHVTGMIGINQKEEEKERGLQRLNWIALRDEPYLESNCVYTAGSLAIASPAIRSIW